MSRRAVRRWRAGGRPDGPRRKLAGEAATAALSPLILLARVAGGRRVRQEAPFFRDPADRSVDGLEALLQLESVGIQRRMPVIGERASDCQAVAMRRLRFLIGPCFQLPLQRTHPTHVLLELFLGMQVSRGNRFGRFAQVVEMTELMRNAR